MRPERSLRHTEVALRTGEIMIEAVEAAQRQKDRNDRAYERLLLRRSR